MAQHSCYLVTGGAGFIGSHLCEALLRLGRQVVVLDNFNSFYDPAIKEENWRQVRATAAAVGAELVQCKGDLRSEADVERAFRSLREPADAAVVHLAAMAGVRPSIADPLYYNDVNINGTLRILEACRTFNVRHISFASSSSVYGNNRKVPFAESDNVDFPISPYAATKKAGELLCHNYHHLYGLSVACLRFFTVYGPRQRPDLAIHKFTQLLAEDRPLPFFGDGTTRRDYTFITDTLQGILGSLDWLAASSAPVYDIFNLGESRTISLNELVDLLGRAIGKTPRLERLPQQPGDVDCTFADISKSREMLGYSPRVEIEEGLAEFVRWYRDWKKND